MVPIKHTVFSLQILSLNIAPSSKMPFLVRPPLHHTNANDHSLTVIVIDPDHNDRSMLQDLIRWDWRVTRQDFDDDEFIEALKDVEQDLKKRRRHTHTVGDDLVGYPPRPTLEDIWHEEAGEKLIEEAYEEEEEEKREARAAESKGYVSVSTQ